MGLPIPTTLTPLPLTFSGRSTGSWIPLPDSTPGESFPLPWALAPPLVPDACSDVCEAPDPVPEDPVPDAEVPRPGDPALAHRFPAAGLSSPTTLTVFPHTFTGRCTGNCTRFPDATPGDPWAAPFASASA
ncbi:hypothetical protein GCM10020254_62070 [Streptomyces goshikiensis]